MVLFLSPQKQLLLLLKPKERLTGRSGVWAPTRRWVAPMATPLGLTDRAGEGIATHRLHHRVSMNPSPSAFRGQMGPSDIGLCAGVQSVPAKCPGDLGIVEGVGAWCAC